MAKSKRPELTEEEYLDIEEAIASDARGRAFLRMREQRARLVSIMEVRRLTRDVKDALAKVGKRPRSKQSAAAPVASTGDAQFNALREELREMSAHITQTRREVAALRPGAGAKRLGDATGELEDIVSAIEAATSEILTGVERIHVLADMLPKNGPDGAIALEIQTRATDVLTACSFQDVTGQRTTQVVNTLRYIEQRVNSMLEIWGLDALTPALEDEVEEDEAEGGEADVPAPGAARQEQIDALFERLKAAQEATRAPVAEAAEDVPPNRVAHS